MNTISLQHAQIHLAELVEQAAHGKPFLIEHTGQAVVQVSAINTPAPQRLGFLLGQFLVPDDFDRMGENEITRSFYESQS